MALGLDEVVSDGLKLGVTDRDDDGELEITDPAPTATNAMFVDCSQDAVVGSVSPNV